MSTITKLVQVLITCLVGIGSDCEEPGGGTSLTADFSVVAIQGTNPIAPCPVLVNGLATDDTDYTEDFHVLDCTYSFGDPGQGSWQRGAAADSGLAWDKNVERNLIAGHMYNDPGQYTIQLFCTAPDGDIDTHQEVFNCGDPETVIGTSDTYCFRAGATDWTGCPLDCAGADAARCIEDADVSEIVANCEGTDNLCYLRGGDTFTQTETLNLGGDEALPTFLTAFGTGNAILQQDCGLCDESPGNGQFNAFALSEGSMVSRIQYDADPNCEDAFEVLDCIGSGDPYACCGTNPQRGCPECGFAASLTNDHIVIADSVVNDITGVCHGTEITHVEGHAFVNLLCNMTTVDMGDQMAGGSFTNTTNQLMMGNIYDNNGVAEFPSRNRGKQGGSLPFVCGVDQSCYQVYAHNDFLDPDDGKCEGDDLPAPACDPLESIDTDTRNGLQLRGPAWGVVIDNVIESNSNDIMSICETNSGCGGADQVDNHDWIVAHNLMRRDQENGEEFSLLSGAVRIQGSKVTVRNNVIDGRGTTGPVRIVEKLAGLAGGDEDYIAVLNNTVLSDDALSQPVNCGNISSLFGDPGGDDYRLAGNLMWVPGWNGPSLDCSGGTWELESGNVVTNSVTSPFDGDQNGTADTPPSMADLLDFRIHNGGAADGTGHSYATDVNFFLHRDVFGTARPLGSYDAGAHERD